MNSDNIIYIGLKLDDESKERLIDLTESIFGEKIYNVFCDHLTLAYGQEVEDFDEELIGTEFSLMSNKIAYDDEIAALVIEKPDVADLGVHNENPHITLATFEAETRPVQSNQMIDNPDHCEEYIEVIELRGKITPVYKRQK